VRPRLASLLLAVASVLVALALGELAVRLVDPDRPGAAAPPAPLPAGWRGLPELHGVFELRRPHARGLYKGVLLRTNSLGVRGPEYALRPPPGVFRIVVAGDSVTMGEGVVEEDAYPAVLERLLAREGRRVEVINLGVSGLNSRQVVGRIEHVGLRYDPHLIVYGYTLNDIQGPHYVGPRPEDQQAWARRLARFRDSPSRLLQVLWPRLWLLASAIHPLPGTYEYTLERNYFHEPAAWAQVTGSLDRLAALARQRGICAHVFVHTRLYQLRLAHPFTPMYRRVEQAALARGLSVTQSLPALRGRDASALRISVADPHPSPEGHRAFAEALREGLERLPPRCFPSR
jgi:lysophospholipase L1-like esterase